MLNLETAITERGREEPKQFHFRAPATALQAFAGAGVDVLSMANNHGVDYGAAGLEDTLAAVASSPIPVVGIGRDAAQAFAPAVVDVRGTSVAVLGGTQVPDRTTAAWRARRTPDPGSPPRSNLIACWRRSRLRGRAPTSSWSTCTGASRTPGARTGLS